MILGIIHMNVSAGLGDSQNFITALPLPLLLLSLCLHCIFPATVLCLLCHQWQYFQQSPTLALMAIYFLCLPALPPVAFSSSPFDINGKGQRLISPYRLCHFISFLWVVFRWPFSVFVPCCSRLLYRTCWENTLRIIELEYTFCLYLI